MAFNPAVQAPAVTMDDLLRQASEAAPTMSPAYGVGANPAAAAAMPVSPPQQIPATNRVPVVSPQANTPAAPAAQPGQTKPPAAPALPRATVPTAGPTLANAERQRLPGVADNALPNFLTEGVRLPGEAGRAYPTATGLGAGGYRAVANAAGPDPNPGDVYSRQQGNTLEYTTPRGNVQFQLGTGDPTGANAFGLTRAQRGQGTLSAPDQGNGGTIEGNVAALESQYRAVRDLNEAKGIYDQKTYLPAFGDMISFGTPGGHFGDEIMNADRAMRPFTGSPYDTPRTKRANAEAASAAYAQSLANAQARQQAQGSRFENAFGPYQERLARAAAARQAAQETAQTARLNERALDVSQSDALMKRLAAARQQGFENEMAGKNYDLKSAEYIDEKARKQTEINAQSKGPKAQLDAAKAQIEQRKAQLVMEAANAKTAAARQAIYEELAKLPGGNANAFNIMGQ